MVDEEQPRIELTAGDEQVGEEQFAHGDQSASADPIIDDERKYKSREADDLLGSRWQICRNATWRRCLG